jgi:CRISPR-associated protein Csb3
VNDRRPNITLKVDVSNPGQFFACCGLLELADRLWPEAEVVAAFSTPRFERSRFCLSASAVFGSGDLVRKLLQGVRKADKSIRPIMGSNGKPVADARKITPVVLTLFRERQLLAEFVADTKRIPLVLSEPVSLRLNWWLDELAGKQAEFKLWGSHLTSEGLISDMVRAVTVDAVTDDTVLESRIGLSSRIGLDVRSSWNTLDEGFSPNDQNLPVDTYPLTELLGAVGLQTFRPAQVGGGYAYTCWSRPVPAVVARAVACGAVPVEGGTRYRFEIGARGKFKFLTSAERSTNE